MKTNISEIVLIMVIIFLVLSSVCKSLYYPTFAFDNVTGYDLMAKVMASEHRINNSLFEINNVPVIGSGKRLLYPPLVSGSFSIAYMLGLKSSKIITSLYFVCFALLFYVLVKIKLRRIYALLCLLFTIITPEFYSFTSLSTTNIPFAVFFSLGLISFSVYFTNKQFKYLILGYIMAMLSSMARSEGIVLCLIGSGIAIYESIKHKRFLYFIIPSVIMWTPFIAWNLYISSTFSVNQNIFVPHLFWDIAKIQEILKWIGALIFNTGLYGITFYAFCVSAIIGVFNFGAGHKPHP
jgi:4-amino-4-deoxy-L-arabinose transferase-like glycosyltransferase